MENRDESLAGGRVAAWRMELPSGKITFDDIKAKQLGYDPHDFTVYQHFTNLVHKDDYGKMMETMKDHLTGKTDRYTVQYRILAADHTYHTFLDSGVIIQQVIPKEGVDTVVVGATVDIS